MISMPNISSDIYYYLHFTAWFMIAFLLHHFIKTYIKPATRTATRPLPSPPSPPALPLIGHLHLVTSVLPTSFQTLANRYGPIMKLHLGASTCVVVSNSRVAKEILKTHELNFSSRPEFGSSKDFLYKDSKFIMAKYGVYWRFMKKLCMTRLLSVPQLDKFIDVRHQEVIKLVESVMASCREGKCLSLGKKLTTYTSNTICRMAMSTRCSEMENEAAEIDKLVRLCLKLAGKQSSGDIWGPLKCLDFSGTRKRLLAQSSDQRNPKTPCISTIDTQRMRRRLRNQRLPRQIQDTNTNQRIRRDARPFRSEVDGEDAPEHRLQCW